MSMARSGETFLPLQKISTRKKKSNQRRKPIKFGFLEEAFFAMALKSDHRVELITFITVSGRDPDNFLSHRFHSNRQIPFILFIFCISSFQFLKLKLHHFRVKENSFYQNKGNGAI